MASRDLCNNIHPVQAIAPGAAVTDNTPSVSAIIDTAGYESVTFVLNLGALVDADATFTVLVEDGSASNLSDAAAVDDLFLVGTEALASFTFADDNKCRKIGYVGSRRYVRLTVTPAANTGNAFVSAVALLGHPHSAPTANPPA